jgi:protein SCO1
MSGEERPSRGPLIALLAVAIGVSALVVALTVGNGGGEEDRAAVIPARSGAFRGGELPPGVDGRRAPGLHLRDARGGTLDTAELRGRPYAITFLYVHCPDVCPLIGDETRRALALLGRQAARVAAVAVSVDPSGDTPGAVRAWLRRHHLPANFRYLIGSERQLKPVWKAYYAAPQIPGRPESTHSASIWLVDAAGRWRTKFSAGVPVPPRDLAHDLRVLLRERDRQGLG